MYSGYVVRKQELSTKVDFFAHRLFKKIQKTYR